jgi:hypothetical protein
MLSEEVQACISDYSGTNVNPQVICCHRYRFIYVRIAKNASTTFSAEFVKDRYGGEKTSYSDLDDDIKEKYFTFAFVRDPVERLLSGYHELIIRETKAPFDTGDYLDIEQPYGRLKYFLSLLKQCKWDNHIRDQLAFLKNTKIDYLACIQSSYEDVAFIFKHLSMGAVPEVGRRRTRIQLVKQEQDRNRMQLAHVFFRKDLDEDLLSSVSEIYQMDVAFYQAVLQARADLLGGYRVD